MLANREHERFLLEIALEGFECVAAVGYSSLPSYAPEVLTKCDAPFDVREVPHAFVTAPIAGVNENARAAVNASHVVAIAKMRRQTVIASIFTRGNTGNVSLVVSPRTFYGDAHESAVGSQCAEGAFVAGVES